MIEVVTKHNIEELLEDPSDYVDSEQDVVLVKVYGKEVGNPVMVMIGTDEEENPTLWYFLLEDNDQELGKLFSTNLEKLKENWSVALELAQRFAQA